METGENFSFMRDDREVIIERLLQESKNQFSASTTEKMEEFFATLKEGPARQVEEIGLEFLNLADKQIFPSVKTQPSEKGPNEDILCRLIDLFRDWPRHEESLSLMVEILHRTRRLAVQKGSPEASLDFILRLSSRKGSLLDLLKAPEKERKEGVNNLIKEWWLEEEYKARLK